MKHLLTFHARWRSGADCGRGLRPSGGAGKRIACATLAEKNSAWRELYRWIRNAPEDELRAIVRDLPLEIELWAGGRGAQRHASIITPRGLIFADYIGYQQELVRLGGHIA